MAMSCNILHPFKCEDSLPFKSKHSKPSDIVIDPMPEDENGAEIRDVEISGITEDSQLDNTSEVLGQLLWEDVDNELTDTTKTRDIKRRVFDLERTSTPSQTLVAQHDLQDNNQKDFTYATPPPRRRNPMIKIHIESPDTARTVPSEDEWVADTEEEPFTFDLSWDESKIGEASRAEESYVGFDRDTRICIDDYHSSTFQSLVGSLTNNQVLTRIELHRLHEVTQERRRTPEEVIHLFDAIRSLPELTEIVLFNFDTKDLDLINVLLSRHPTLEFVHIHLTDGTPDDLLLGTLVEMPILNEVILEVQESFSLSTLLESKTLQYLRVPSFSFAFEEQEIVAFMHALGYNTTLLSLDLRPDLSFLGMRALSLALEDNSTLEALRFSFTGNESQSGNAFLDLSNSLSKNTRLTIVQNYLSDSVYVQKGDWMKIQAHLRANTTLLEIDLIFDKGYTAMKQASRFEQQQQQQQQQQPKPGFFGMGWIMPCVADFEQWQPDNINLAFHGLKDQILSLRGKL